MQYLPDRIQEFIEDEHLFRKTDYVVVALSGGADSVCLLETLIWNGYRVGAVHVNHHLRESAKRDEAFVRDLCEGKNVPLVVKHVDVKTRRDHTGETLEEAARNLRREALLQGAEELFPESNAVIATAHQKNDQAETVLFHLIRGTSLKGAGGIPVRNGRFVRPLLAVTREEIEAWLGEQGIEYCHDETNDEDDATRNQIRHHILSRLEEIRPGAVEKLAREACIFHDADAYISKEAKRKIRECAVLREDGQALSIPAELMANEEPIMQWYLAYEALVALGLSVKDKSQKHLAEICELAWKPVGKKALLPGGGIAVRTYRTIELRTAMQEPETGDGETTRFLIEIRRFRREKNVKYEESFYTKRFDCDKMNGFEPILRTRRPGDRIALQKGGHTRLKEYFIDEKIPAEERDRIPIVAIGSEVLWVFGRRVSEEYRMDDQTVNIMEITIKERTT